MTDKKPDETEDYKDGAIEARLGEAADKFSAQLAAGQNPSIDQFAKQFPEIAETIRQVFPVLREIPVLELLEKPNEKPNGQAEPSSAPRRGSAGMASKTLGDYELLREIGHGAMGIVYEARQISLDKRVALKILPFAGALDPRSLQRFQNEARAAAQLQHPNIVPVHGVGRDRGTHFYAMQYIEGNNLAEVIRHLQHKAMEGTNVESTDQMLTIDLHDENDPEATQPFGGGLREWAETAKSSGLLRFKTTKASNSNAEYFQSFVKLAIQVAEALQHAHDEGVVHRDIKPSNLMLDTHGNAWITDFGLAQVQGDAAITATGEAIGTLRYMSPEQALAKRIVVDHRTDIYSLGATLYELLTLQPARDGQTRPEVMRQIAFEDPIAPRKVDRRIPTELETIVTTAMAKNPDERYQTAQEMADDLRRHQSDEPIRAQPPNVAQRAAKWARRHRGIVSSAAATISVVFLATLISLWFVFAAWSSEFEARAGSEKLLRESEGLRLAAQSMLERPKNPGLALSLALEGRRRYESLETNNALLQALDENHEWKTLRGHSASVGSVAFSPDARWAVTAVTRSAFGKSNEPARIWDVETGKQLRLIAGKAAITSMNFSPRGGRLLTASSPFGAEMKDGETEQEVGGPPCLYDAATGGKLIELPEAFLFEAHAACFSPSGQLVVAPARGNKARIYDVVEGFPQRDFKGHTARVDFAAFSPTGKYVVTISRDKTVRIWEAATGKELQRLTIWKSRVPTMAVFSPDERLLATGSQEGAHLWDVSTAKNLSPTHWIGNLVRFSPDGGKLFTAASFAREVHAYDTANRVDLYRIRDISLPIRALEVSPFGEYLGIAAGNTVEMRRFDDGTRRAVLRGHNLNVETIRFSSSGQQVISGASDKTARIWNVRSGAERARFDAEPAVNPQSLIVHTNEAARVAVLTETAYHTYVFDLAKRTPVADFMGSFDKDSQSGHKVITINKNRAAVWDHQNRRELAFFRVPVGKFGEALLSSDGQTAVTVVEGGPVTLWNLIVDRRDELAGHTERVYSAAFSPNGEYVATACKDGSIRLWRTASAELVRKLQISGAAVSVEFSPDGDRLMAVSNQDTAHVWRVSTGEHLFDLRDALCRFNRASFSPRGDYVITYKWDDNETVACWSATEGKLLRSLSEPRGTVSITFSKTRPILIAASKQHGLFRWDFETNKSQRITETGIACAAFDSDERRIVSATFVSELDPEKVPSMPPTKSVTPMLRIWDAESLQSLDSFPIQVGAVSRLRFTPQGELLVSAMCYGAAVLDSRSLEKVAEIAGHAAPIAAMQFGPKAQFIATASWDHTAAVWDPATGRLLQWLVGHQSAVTSLAVHPTSSEMATAAADGEVIVWNITTGARIRSLRGHKDLVYQVLYHPQELVLLTSSRDGELRVWNNSGETVHSIKSLQGVFLSIAFSPQGHLLALPAGEQIPSQHPLLSPAPRSFHITEQNREGAPKSLAVHLYRSWHSAPILLEHDVPPKSAAFSNDGSRAVTVDTAGAAYVWELAAIPRRQWKLFKSTSPILSACFSPDGKSVLTRHSNEISLWNVENGNQLALFLESGGISVRHGRIDPTANPFTPDSQFIVAIEQQKYLRRWPVDILSHAGPFAPADLSSDEKAAFHIRE